MDKDVVEQFLLYLKEEEQVKHVHEFTVEHSWYRRGYQQAVRRIEQSFRIAFDEEL
jgi:hypothetical protein